MKSEQIQAQNELAAAKALVEELQKQQKKDKAINVKKLPEYVTIQNQVNDLTKQLQEKTKEATTSKAALDRANEKLETATKNCFEANKMISDLNRTLKNSPTSSLPVVPHNSISAVVVSKGSKKNTPKQTVASENEDDVEDLRQQSPSQASDSDDVEIDLDNSFLRALVDQKKQIQKQKQGKLLEQRKLLKQLAELSAKPSIVDDTGDVLRSVSQRDYLSSSVQVIHCFYQHHFCVILLCHISLFCSNNSRNIC